MDPALFQAMFDSSPVGLALLGKNESILLCNNALRAMAGADILLDPAQGLRTIIAREFRHSYSAALREASAGKTGNVNARIVLPDGSEAWWNISLNKGTYTQKGKQFLIAAIKDITGQQQGRDKLLNERDQLKKAHQQAERSAQVKSDFLANMSHEIRTPIHTITGMTELLDETKLDPEQQEYADQVRFSADVLLSLVNDILDFSKIEAGKLSLESIDFPLSRVIEQAVDLVALEAHKKGLEACIYIEDTLPEMLKGDPTRIRQIVVNLFNNAVKFTSKGEIVVSANRVNEDDSTVTAKFIVRDSGIGIPEEKMERLFKEFSQVDSSTTRKYGGTGLGLSISKKLVEMMSGQMGVESTPGKGSAFWFTVPLLKSDKHVKQADTHRLQERRILIVDDSSTTRSILRRYLESWGVIVQECNSGEKALFLLKEQTSSGTPFDAVLIDLIMPRMDGWHLASEINSDKTINEAKLFLMSPAGKSGDEAKMKLLKWFDEYLNKPIKRDQLAKTLLSVLDGQSAVEDLHVEHAAPAAPEIPENTEVLIAEDHLVNQKLFKAIMESFNAEVTLAVNGKEAALLAQQRDFDIIFMDVQMPELNGYEATKLIRKAGNSVPIIAVTANVIKGEREKCIDAGMDDFLSKPFKKKDISPLLVKYLAPQSANLQPEDLDEEDLNTANKEVQIDSKIFDTAEALDTFMDNSQLLLEALEGFLTKSREQVKELSLSLTQGDMKSIRELGHSIKGSALNLHAADLAAQAEKMELAGAEGKLSRARSLMKKLTHSLENFDKEVRKFILDQDG